MSFRVALAVRFHRKPRLGWVRHLTAVRALFDAVVSLFPIHADDIPPWKVVGGHLTDRRGKGRGQIGPDRYQSVCRNRVLSAAKGGVVLWSLAAPTVVTLSLVLRRFQQTVVCEPDQTA